MSEQTATKAIGLLVADDHRLIREGVIGMVSGAPDISVIGEACDGAEVVTKARELKPDVVLLDISMPKIDGLQAASRLLSMEGAPKVLMLAGFDARTNVPKAISMGASGFLLKEVGPEELVDSIRVVARGGTVLGEEAARIVGERLNSARSEFSEVAENLDSLTSGERDVLRGVRAGMPNSAIAEELFMSEYSVKTYVSRILKKLGLDNRTQAAIVAYEAGLR
ncbi:response regulator [Streptomyces sp. x-80]|uniref:response regulator n=1 Tax=Streptomyces sp. x-80 TaxID=2789282 RepID=UPI0039810E57